MQERYEFHECMKFADAGRELGSLQTLEPFRCLKKRDGLRTCQLGEFGEVGVHGRVLCVVLRKCESHGLVHRPWPVQIDADDRQEVLNETKLPMHVVLGLTIEHLQQDVIFCIGRVDPAGTLKKLWKICLLYTSDAADE